MTEGVSGGPRSGRAVGQARQPCSGDVEIFLLYGNDADVHAPYMRNSNVLVGGQVRITLKSSGGFHKYFDTTTGKATFFNVPCGNLTVTAQFIENIKIVRVAKAMVGRTEWAYSDSRSSFDGKISFPRATNKCNLFIYDMIQKSYGSAPTYTYYRGGIELPFFDKTVAALAGSWADFDNSSSDPTPGWKNVNYQNRVTAVPPGSILAIRIPYSDASGHVSIISYPLEGQATGRLAGGKTRLDVVMPGRTISATATQVVENNWGFRTSASYEHESLNAPAAGIELRK